MLSSLKSKNFEQTLRSVIQQSKESIETSKQKQLEQFGKLESRYAYSKNNFTNNKMGTEFSRYNLFVEFMGVGSVINENAGIDLNV